MKGAQERKRDNEDPRKQSRFEKEQQLVPDVSEDQENPSTGMTNDSPSPSTANATPGRIGRQRSFLKKSLFEETQSDTKKSPREQGNLLRGVATPTFVFESPGETVEEITKSPIVRRPTGWVGTKHVEWEEDLDDVDDVDGDEKEPPAESYTSSSPSSQSSPVESVLKNNIYDEDDRNHSQRSLSPLFSTPRQTFDQTSHITDSIQQKLDIKLNLVKPTPTTEGSESILGQSTSSTSSALSTSSSGSDSLNGNTHLNAATKTDIQQAPSTYGDHLKAQSGEVGPAGPKILSSSCIMPAKCMMRSPEVPYIRRRSSSSVPTQESDLLKEWTRKRLEEVQERDIKSEEDQKKVLEGAQKARDAFYEQRRAEINMERARNRQQEKQKMEETQDPKLPRSMNHWELVVSLVNLEKPTGPPTEKDDKKRLYLTQAQLQPGPPSLPIKTLPGKSSMNQDKNKVMSLAVSEDIVVEENQPLLKNTDLSRMKEILLKLKHNPPNRDGDQK